MAQNSVTTTFFANEREAQAAIARLEKKYGDLENKLKQVSKRSREGSRDATSGLNEWAGSLATIAAGYVAIPALIGEVIDANKEMLRQADDAALKYDRLFRRFRMISGMTAVQSEEAKARIKAIAVATATPIDVAETVAEELVGEGFKPEEASGKALKTLLETRRAGGMEAGDAGLLARAAAMFLAAQGKEKTDENLRPVMVGVQRLFKEMSLKLEDLIDLAGKSMAAAGSLTTPQTIAVMALLRQKNTGDVASTAFKIIIDRLQTIAARPADAAMLSKLGLKPGDVDLVGEDISTVLDRFAAGKDRVTPEMWNIIASGIFEERARSPFEGLLRDRGMLPGLLDKMKDEAGFAADVNVATGGKFNARVRTDTAAEALAADMDSGFEDFLRAARLVRRARGDSAGLSSLEEGASRFFQAIPGMGGIMDALRARELDAAVPGTLFGDVKRVMEAAAESNSKLLEVLQEIRDNTRGRSRREEPGAS